MIAMIIATFVMGGLISLLISYSNAYNFSFEESQKISAAQGSLTRIIKDIREARQSETGAWPLVTTNDTELTFYADVTDDGIVDRVRYFLVGNQLKKGVITPTGTPLTYNAAQENIFVIADGVDMRSAPVFKYYNGNWPADKVANPLPSASRILNTRMIQATIRINPSGKTSATLYESTSSATIRSLKDNL